MLARAEAPRRRWNRRSRLAFFLACGLWLLCFALSARASLVALPSPSVFVRPDAASGHPRVDGHRLADERGHELQVGDILLAWGGRSLRGATDLDLFHYVALYSEPSGVARVTVRRDGAVRDVQVTTGSFRVFWPRLPASLIFVLTAAVFVFRSPENPLTRSIVCMLMSWGLLFACTFAGPPWAVYLATAVQVAGVSGACVFGLRMALLFPHGLLPSSALLRVVPYPFALLGPLDVERTQGAIIPYTLAHQIGLALTLIFVVTNIALAMINYRRSDALERRKWKWLLWAVWIASLVSALGAALAIATPALSLHYYVSLTAVVLVPLALLISITRYNLFDIDRILSATAALSLLLGVAVGALLLGAPLLTRSLSHAFGLSAAVAQPIVVLALAVLTVVCARLLHPWLDGKLFVERAALQRGLAALLREIRGSSSPRAAFERAGSELARLLSPQTLAIYQRGEPSWQLGFAAGHAVAPAIPCESRIFAALDAADDVLCLELGRGPRPAELSALDRSLLQALDARVVLGVRGHERLDAVIVIGAKGSGDLFVPSDLALLSAIAHALSETLARLQREGREEDGERARKALERYVPGPLVSQIVRGMPIEQGEQEVTLMFVDIRGYSAFAERHAPSEVYEVVSRYTRAVTDIVLRHRGAVVEFNGDGMMTLFGAPEPLPQKEESAVQAALELLEAAARIVPIARTPRGLAPIGVGIATGRAFVGSIRGSDRSIWTALGASTNRAARLQAITRELHVDLVIDEATYRALGTTRRRFELHAGVALRGHARRQNLYALVPTEPAQAAAIRVASAG